MIAYGVETVVVVLTLVCAAFVGSIVFGLRMKLPALGGRTPWANGYGVATPRPFWWLFWVGQGVPGAYGHSGGRRHGRAAAQRER